VRRYHFLEGIIKSWKDVSIQENSVVKKFKNYPSMFDTLKGTELAIELLIKKYSKKIIIFSYSSNSLPQLDFFKKIGTKNNMNTTVKKINYTYSFGTQNKCSLMKNIVVEFIITMKNNG
jgi:DNA adenine methylase